MVPRRLALLFCLLAAVAFGVNRRVGAATAGTVHLPDLHTIIPPAEISIVRPSPTSREFRYTHITSNLGDGPFELRPQYDPATDTARGFQRFYTHDAAGNWSLVSETAVVGTFAYHSEHGHFHFPFAQFGLFHIAADGSVGAPAALSAKIGYCIADSLKVADIPHVGAFGYSGGGCSDPRSVRGVSVGWGDRYDLLDDGQSIDITSLPDGDYWFRALSDPYNYLVEKDETNNATDLKVRISGTTVTVLDGPVSPNSQPPSVSMTAPSAGPVAGSNVVVSADASDPSGIARVQFLIDGNPLGPPLFGPPYVTEWDTTTISDGTHYVSAQATAGSDFHGTATPITVTVSNSAPPPPPPPNALYISNVFAGNRTSSSVTITWTTNVPASSQVDYGLDVTYGTSAADPTLVTTHAIPSGGLSPSTTYHYQVTSQDDQGHLATAGDFIFTTAGVSELSCTITAPVTGETVSGTTTISADSSGTASVSGVQFQIDGNALGPEDADFPYSIDWETSAFANGDHAITAVARDPTGNRAQCGAVPVSVFNAAPPPGTGLALAFGFNEGFGTTTSDASGNSNGGSVSGATWAAGRFGQALSFDGVNDLVSVNDSASLDLTNALTLEAWVYPRALSSWRTVLLKERPGQLAYALYGNTDTNRPSAEIAPGSNVDVRAPSQLSLNAWSHLAATYDGATLKLYVNGALANSRLATGAAFVSADALRIGGNSIWGEYFNGLIDEVRLYSRALAQNEIQADMTTAVGGAPPPDTTPPTRSSPQPSGTLPAGTTSTTLQLTTDEAATCRYASTAGTSYAAMPAVFATTGGIAHATPVSGLINGTTYTYYVRCADARGNVNATDFTITFAIASPNNFEDSWVTDVPSPTALTFTPDGRLLVTSQTGELRVFQSGALIAAPALNLATKICSNSERGLLGVAVDPAFATTGHIYLFYTFKKFGVCPTNTSSSPVNRVSRFELRDDNTVDTATELILIDNVPSPNGNHNAGDVQVGSDGYLYISTGDGGCDYAGNSGCAGANDASRDQHILLGKILRITRDGGIPPDNPFQGAGTARCAATGGTTAGNKCQETFASGLRNPFRMAFDPNASTTRFFINDVGQDTWEEVNLGEAGADYGWNVREGNCVRGSTTNCGLPPVGLTNPIYAYDHSAGCASITGGAFVPRGIWPTAYDDSYLFSDYVCGTIFKLDAGPNGYTRSDFATGLGANSAVAMAFGPHGPGQALYYTTYAGGGEVRRIAYTGPSNRTPTAVASATPTWGALPLEVAFDGSASSDPDGGVLEFEWDFGDGNAGSGQSVRHTYVAAATHVATLRVRDSAGAVGTATVRIDAGNTAPVPAITAPAASMRFRVGQTVTLQGTATDSEDGTLPDSSLAWTVILHHSTHTHPFLPATIGNNITMTAPAPEDLQAATNSYLEIWLVATDSRGLTSTVIQELRPHLVDVTLATSPTGLKVLVNDLPIVAPATLVSWEAYQLTVDAPTQVDGFGRTMTFQAWSDGGSARHIITTPATASTYTVTFAATVSGLVAAYAFEEGIGTSVADASGNSNVAIISGATWSTAGKSGKALSFDGVNDWVSVADASSLDLTTGLTLEAWVHPASLSGWRTVVMKERTAGLAYALYAHDNAPRPAVTVNVGSDQSSTGAQALPLNTWSHLAGTYDGTTLRLYVNGALVSSRPLAGSMSTSAQPLRLGGNAVWGEYFAGLIDDVRVYSRALSQSEVQADMTTPVGGAPPPDTTPPTRSNPQPSGTLPAGTTSTTLQLTTDEAATCRYASTAGTSYAAMPAVFATTGGTAHATPVSGLINGTTYTYYVRCADAVGNVNTADFLISFAVASPLAGDVVAAYAFGEGTGTILRDTSGNGNDGTILNATWTTAGRYGSALVFNGSTAWVTVADAASLDLTTGMTLEAWVRPSVTMSTSWRSIILKERSGGLCYSLYANTTAATPGTYINVGGADQNVQGTSAIPTNAWTHLAATYDGTTLRLYVNGALVRSATVAGALVTSGGVLRIGGNAVWGERFNGYIDEVRLYNRALSAGEIANDMNSPVVP
jgi:glucose/arabinose dehydrogenase